MSLEIKNLLEEQGRTFEEFKRANEEKSKNADILVKEQAEKLAQAVAGLEELKQQIQRIEAKSDLPEGIQTGDAVKDEEVKAAFRQWIHDGKSSKTLDLAMKSFNITTAADGAYMLPRVVEEGIYKRLEAVSPVRSLFDFRKVKSFDYKRNIQTEGVGYEWVGEQTSRAAATSSGKYTQPAIFQAGLRAAPDVSSWALQDMEYNVEQDLQNDIVKAFQKGEGAGVISGAGSSTQIKGLLSYTFASTADDIRTFGELQYIATGVADNFSADPFADIKALIAELGEGHLPNAKFSFNRSVLGTLTGIKDTTGRYLWEPDLKKGQPTLLLGYEVVLVPDMPGVGANAYPVTFGDHAAAYVPMDRAGISTLRDPFSNVGFIRLHTERRIGNYLQDSDAVKALKCAVS